MTEFKVTFNVEGSNDKESISKMVGILTKGLNEVVGANKPTKIQNSSLYGEYGKGIKIHNIDYPGEVVMIEGGKLAILNVGEKVYKSANEIGEALKSVLPDKYKPLEVLEHYSKQAIGDNNLHELNRVLKSLEKYLMITPVYKHDLVWLNTLRYEIEESVNIEDGFSTYDLKLTAITTIDRILNNGHCIKKAIH